MAGENLKGVVTVHPSENSPAAIHALCNNGEIKFLKNALPQENVEENIERAYQSTACSAPQNARDIAPSVDSIEIFDVGTESGVHGQMAEGQCKNGAIFQLIIASSPNAPATPIAILSKADAECNGEPFQPPETPKRRDPLPRTPDSPTKGTTRV